MNASDFAMWATFAIIIATITAYAIEKWSIEAVSLAAVAAFLIVFGLDDSNGAPGPGDIVAGFANPALISVLSLLIIGQGLFQTDALDGVSGWLSGIGGRSRTRTLAVILIGAALISAVLNNTPVVVMLVPVMTTIARQKNFEAAKGLMPLSFATILGGMTTLIGSSTNLLVAGMAAPNGVHIGFFDITGMGLILAGAGMIYVMFAMPAILNQRSGMAEQIRNTTGKQFIAEIDISAGHPLEGIQSRAGLFVELSGMTVRTILRNDLPILPPFENIRLMPGDVVIVAATRTALTKALARGSAGIAMSDGAGEEDGDLQPHFTIAEVVVAPGSRYASRTLQGAGIRANEGVQVLGLQRKSHMQRSGLADIRLEPGDTILVGGRPEDVSRLRASRDLLLLEASKVLVPMRRKAPVALAIFAAVVALAALEVLPIMVTALVGALAMIVTGCINVRQAKRAFDSRIYMLVGASLASATALERSGGADYLASAAANAMDGMSPAFVLSAFFLVLAVLTNILSNNATAVLFTPVALSMAKGMGIDPLPFVAAVIYAANCSFATPVGYQTNLLVMGPGHYRFQDFLRAGGPLVIIVWLTYSFAAPWYYGL
ncbi:MAG: SLC13 family permease [Nitratireductor sp.]